MRMFTVITAEVGGLAMHEALVYEGTRAECYKAALAAISDRRKLRWEKRPEGPDPRTFTVTNFYCEPDSPA